jgi:hypothetical protein
MRLQDIQAGAFSLARSSGLQALWLMPSLATKAVTTIGGGKERTNERVVVNLARLADDYSIDSQFGRHLISEYWVTGCPRWQKNGLAVE